MNSRNQDEDFMREALRLARRGVGKTHPNPAVGCVLVRGKNIVGAGWHRRAGEPHAEIVALRSLKKSSLAQGATAYVTLEPCSTHGRTPPCTQALLDAGISRVVLGAIDPNPKHQGCGLMALRQAGVTVTEGILSAECAALNPEFHWAMISGLPWVIAKCGMSLDGRLTRPVGETRWLTSPAARADAMRLRARVDAILVGAGTIRADNPSLTVRGVRRLGEPPWRVVWAPHSLPPQNVKIFHDALRERTVVMRDKSLRTVLKKLRTRGMSKVLIEGGGHTLGCAFDAQLVNEMVFYVAPLLAGGTIPAVGGRGVKHMAQAAHLEYPKYRRLGECLRISGTLTVPCGAAGH